LEAYEMKRNLFFALVMVLMFSLILTTITFAQNGDEGKLHPIEIRNRTDQPVNLVLLGTEGGGVYSLTVPADTTKKFTLQKDLYNHTTFACGEFASGTLDVSKQLRLVFTRCFGEASNPGEPTMEKVHLSDTPQGINWLFQYGKQVLPGITPVQNGGPVGVCQLTTKEATTLYSRPSTAANVFAEVGPEFEIQVVAKTQDGWLGIDPAVAQAANIGSFRLRWVPPGTRTLSGDCGNLPVVWGPPPGVCFDMPMGDTNVFEQPDFNTTVLAVLHVGEFAEVLGKTSDGAWALVDLKPGNTGKQVEGWVDAGTLNFNGPCGGLPTVSP
jgi:hypothetical protein